MTANVNIHVTPVLSYHILSVDATVQDPANLLPVPNSAQTSPIGRQNGGQKAVPQRNLTIVLDRSGSMSGGPIRSARLALSSIVPDLLSDYRRVRLVLFNHFIESHDLSLLSPRAVTKVIDDIAIDGGTSFQAVFDHIVSTGSTTDHSPETFLFLTDGADSNGNFHAKSSLLNLKASLRSLRAPTTIHCIGLGTSHDASLMAALTATGSHNGTFAYARDQSGIYEAFKNVLDCTDTEGIDATLLLRYADGVNAQPHERLPIILSRLEEEGTSSVRGSEEKDENTHYEVPTIVVPTRFTPLSASIKLLSGIELQATIVRHTDPYEELNSQKETPNTQVLLDMANDIGTIVDDRVSFHTTRMPTISSEKEAVREIHYEFKALATTLSKLSNFIARTNNKETRKQLLNAKMLMNTFQNTVLVPLIRSGGIDNVQYAKLAHMAFDGVRKRRTETLIGSRVIRNSRAVNSLEDQIFNVVEEIDFNNEASFRDTEEYNRCIFSFLDYKEALQQGDCICLGLEIQRPEAAVADPSRIVVKRVGTSVVTATSFLSAVLYRLNDTDVHDATDVHGGFTVGQSGIVLHGTSRDVINAALPLYINETHWRVARLRGRPLLGWMATLDVLGFSHEQGRTIPFLVLNAVWTAGVQSEYWARVERWVYETCARVMTDSTTLQEQLFVTKKGQDVRLRYLEDVEARLSDVVASHDVFLCQIEVAKRMGMLQLSKEQTKRLGALIVAEDYRRRSRGKNSSLSASSKMERIATLVGCHKEKDVMPLFSQCMDSLMKGPISDCYNVDVDEVSKLCIGPKASSWDVSRLTSNDDHSMFDSLVKWCNKWLHVLPIMTGEQKAAMALVHLKFTKSSDIREQSEKYDEALTLAIGAPLRVLRNTFKVVVRKMVRDDIAAVFSSRRALMQRKVARMFATARDEAEIMATVGTCLYVGRNVGLCAKSLCEISGDAEEVGVLWKMRILMEGRVKGEALFIDVDEEKRREQFNGLAWMPRRQIVRGLFRKFVLNGKERADGTVVDDKVRLKWVDTFPWLQRNLEIWCGVVDRTAASSVTH